MLGIHTSIQVDYCNLSAVNHEIFSYFRWSLAVYHSGNMIDPNSVTSVALDFWRALPKNGKPQPNEWTVYAGVYALRMNN